MLNPIQLSTYLAVLDTGSFADAGRVLGYTSSAVSQQINALERQSGLVLFERGAHRVIPTSAALALADRARDVCLSLKDLSDYMKQISASHRGRLRLGTFPTASARIVPKALAEFVRRQPLAEVMLDEAEPSELVARLVKGEIDLILVYEYDLVPQQWPAGVTCQEILREDLLLLVNSSCGAYKVDDFSALELEDSNWIASREGTAGSAALSRLCADLGFQPRISFRSNNYELICSLVQAGLGVALVPTLGYIPDSNIRSIAVPGGWAFRRVMTMYRQGNANALIAEAVSVLSSVVSRETAWQQSGAESAPSAAPARARELTAVGERDRS